MLALSFGLALLGCEKGSSNNPGGGGDPGASEGGGGEVAEGGADYVYPAEGFKLVATTNIKLEIATPEGQGTATVSARSSIDATPEGEQLKIHGKVVELISYDGQGQLDPEFQKKRAEEAAAAAEAAGEEVPEITDMVAELASAEGWTVMDRKGETDDDATKALAENQEDAGGDEFGLFGIPDLPTVDLEPGKKVSLPTEADEVQLPFGSIPTEVDVTWTLRGIEGSVAELDVFVESSGATEIDGGGASVLVSVLSESAYTVYFDVGTKLPISISGYSQNEISIDLPDGTQQISTNNEVEKTYEVVQ